LAIGPFTTEPDSLTPVKGGCGEGVVPVGVVPVGLPVEEEDDGLSPQPEIVSKRITAAEVNAHVPFPYWFIVAINCFLLLISTIVRFFRLIKN
jgi:hypothetical protein